MESGYSGEPWLMPTEMQQAELERWNGTGFATAVRGKDLFFREFPIERRFFSALPRSLQCVQNARAIPHAGSECSDGAERKHHCGNLRQEHCAMWSVGSNGQTCFEEEWHALAPLCKVHVFDPTLSARARDKLGRLQRNGMLRLHSIGLSSKAGKGILQAGLTRRAESLTLLQMMRHTNTTWIDYLKTDCEGCEFAAVAQFLDEMRRGTHGAGHTAANGGARAWSQPGAHTRVGSESLGSTTPIRSGPDTPEPTGGPWTCSLSSSRLASSSFTLSWEVPIRSSVAEPRSPWSTRVRSTVSNPRVPLRTLLDLNPCLPTSLEAQSLQADDDSSC